MTAASLMETESVSKQFRVGSGTLLQAVDRVTLAIPRGSFVLIRGPSGSGKSTLLGLLGALQRPTRGHVMVDGESLEQMSDVGLARVRRRMGFVFQNFSLIEGLSVLDNMTYPMIPRGLCGAERNARGMEWLDRVRLKHRAHDRPERLSGGEQQRVAVARALACEPDILLADEPTSNLDQGTAEILELLLDEIHARGTTVVVVSHDARLIARATMELRLDNGRLDETGQKHGTAASS